MLLAVTVAIAVTLALTNLFLGILAYAKRKKGGLLVVITIVMVVVYAAMILNGFWMHSIDGPHTALGSTIILEVVGGTIFGGGFLLAAIDQHVN